MISIFRRIRPAPERPASDPPATLSFKSGSAFFEYQCEYGFSEIKIKTAIIALVIDAQKELGTPTAI